MLFVRIVAVQAFADDAYWQIIAPLCAPSFLKSICSRVLSSESGTSPTEGGGNNLCEGQHDATYHLASSLSTLLTLCKRLDEIKNGKDNPSQPEDKPTNEKGYVVKVSEEFGSKHNPIRNISLNTAEEMQMFDKSPVANSSSEAQSKQDSKHNKLSIYYQLLNTLAFLPTLSTSLWSWVCFHLE